MSTTNNILISLEDRHAKNIFSGQKTVEFRTRKMHVEIGTIVWIYVKIPVGAIVGKAVVKECHSLAPSTLWNRFSNTSGLSKKEFFSYFEDVEKGFALSLTSAERILSPVSLDILRSLNSNFQPPQFFTRLHEGDPLLNALNRKKKIKRIESL